MRLTKISLTFLFILSQLWSNNSSIFSKESNSPSNKTDRRINVNTSDFQRLNAQIKWKNRLEEKSSELQESARFYLEQSQLPNKSAGSFEEVDVPDFQFSIGLNNWKIQLVYDLNSPLRCDDSEWDYRRSNIGITINGSASAEVGAGEEFDLEFSFPAGTDSLRLDIVYDADADTVLDSTDMSLFDIRFVDDDLQGGAFWFYPDSADTAATISVDDFPYMGISLICEISNSTNSAQAYLMIDAAAGDYSISGNVSGSSSTYPSLLVIQGGEGPEEEYSWLTFSSVYQTFSFNYEDGEGPSRVSAMDVYDGRDTGSWMLVSQAVEDLDQSLALDLTQNASLSGTVSEEGSNAGPADIRISAVGQAAATLVFSYNFTSDSGTFEIPLQGYTVLYNGFQVGHPDYQQAECDADEEPLYILPGDALEFDCSIAPWPAFIEGTVTDPDGDPLPGIPIRVELDNVDFGRTVRTNGEGFYSIGSLLGVAELCANPQGNPEYQPDCIFPLSINDDLVEQDFVLDPWEAAIEVEVYDHETDDPIAGARVDVFVAGQQDGMRPRRTETDDDGIALIGVSNGTFRVCAEHLDLGYERECEDQVAVHDDTVDVELGLVGPEAFLEGYVFDSEEFTPIEDITVIVIGGENQGTDVAQRFDLTDENGFYRVGVHNGSYIVCFLDFENVYLDTCIGPVDAENGTTSVPIVYLEMIEYDGAIVGTVADQYDIGVPAFVVAVDTTTGEDENPFYYTVTNLSGEYTLPVMNGDFIMSADPFNEFYLPGIAVGVSVDDDTVTQDFETPALIRDAVIYGAVTDSNNTALEGAQVIVATWRGFEEILWFAKETDDSGSYEMRIPGFDDRAYWVYGQYGDDEEDDEILVGSLDSLIITSGDTVEADLILRPEVFDGRIYGTVTVSDEPLAGVEVTASNYQSGREFLTYTDDAGFFELEVDYGEFVVCAHYWAFEEAECVVANVNEDHNEITVTIEYGVQVETLDNNRGNFRFTWGNDGSVTRGEWPAGSGRNYLAGGGLVTIGYMGESVMAGGMIEESWDAVPESFGGYLGWISRNLTDSGSEHSTGVEVSEAIFSPPGNQSFVIIYSEVSYPGDFAAMEGFRIGYFLDWDVAMSPNGIDSADDDMVGIISTEITHPVLTVMIPIKISYMMDNDGDQGTSPGYVGMVTFAGENLMEEVNHVVIDLEHEEPDSPEEIAELIDVDEDSENPDNPGDYAILQLSEAMSITAGDTLDLITILMAGENPQAFADMVQNILNNLINLSIEDQRVVPTEFALHQNYPNPFNPVTTIQYDVPVGVIHELPLQLQIFDIGGRMVATLVDRPHAPGRYSVRWDASDMSSGMYFYRISSAKFTATKKLVLMK